MIGVMDTGAGGLTVLKCLIDVMPGEDFLYLGDTARAPYGDGRRTEKEIRELTEDVLSWFEKKGAKLVVLACNTLTVLGPETLKKGHPFNIAGMSLGADAALKETQNKKIGVMGAQFTIKSRAHAKALKARDKKAEIIYVNCPKLEELVESGNFKEKTVKEAVQGYVKELKDADTVILACTHYPFFKREIEKEFKGKVIDPAEETALLVKEEIERTGLLKKAGRGKIKITATAGIEKMERLAKRMIKKELEFEEINLKKS